MILLQAGPAPSKLPSVLFVLLLIFVVWRIIIAIARASKSSESKATQKKSWTLSRRDVIDFFNLEYAVNKYDKDEPKNIFLLGVRNIFAESPGLHYPLSILVWGILIATAKWLWNGWQTAFPIKIVIIAFLITVSMFFAYLFLYWLAYKVYKDFRFLLEGAFVRNQEAQLKAFQQAAEIHPSEYAFTKLGNAHSYTIRSSKEAWVDAEWDFELDYSQSFQYLNQAIQLNPTEISPYLLRAVLRERIKDYYGAIEDYRKIQQLKQEKHPTAKHINDNSFLAKTYRDWGRDLLIACEYDEAINKFSIAIQLFGEHTNNGYDYWTYWQRSKAYLILGDFSKAKDDLIKVFELIIMYYQNDLEENAYYKSSYTVFEEKGWPETLMELIDYSFVVFKTLEDQNGAIILLKKYIEKDAALHLSLFFNKLLALLVFGGKTNEAKEIFDNNRHRKMYRHNSSNKKLVIINPDSFLNETEIIKNTEITADVSTAKRIVTTALENGHFDTARKYLKQLEASSKSLDDRIFLYENMGLLLEREWRFTESLKYYVELFQIRENQVNDERKIGEIKVLQRDFYQALDAYEGYFSAVQESGQLLNNRHIIDYAKVKEATGDYLGAMEILSSFGRNLKESGFYYDLKKKQAIKRHMSRY